MFCKIAVTLLPVVTTTAAFFAPDKFAKLRGLHIETSELICSANQLTGFYMRVTLAFNGLV